MDAFAGGHFKCVELLLIYGDSPWEKMLGTGSLLVRIRNTTKLFPYITLFFPFEIITYGSNILFLAPSETEVRCK